MSLSCDLLSGWVGNGTDGHLAVSFHSPRLETPQEKLVPRLFQIPRVPSTVSRAGVVLSNMGFLGAPWGWGGWQDLMRLWEPIIWTKVRSDHWEGILF